MRSSAPSPILCFILCLISSIKKSKFIFKSRNFQAVTILRTITIYTYVISRMLYWLSIKRNSICNLSFIICYHEEIILRFMRCHLSKLSFFFISSCFETRTCLVQTGLELTMQQRLALTSNSSHSSAGITSMLHFILVLVYFEKIIKGNSF